MNKEILKEKIDSGNLAAEIRHKLPMYMDPTGFQAQFGVHCLLKEDSLEVIIKPSKNYKDVLEVMEKFFARDNFELKKAKEEVHYIQFEFGI